MRFLLLTFYLRHIFFTFTWVTLLIKTNYSYLSTISGCSAGRCCFLRTQCRPSTHNVSTKPPKHTLRQFPLFLFRPTFSSRLQIGPAPHHLLLYSLPSQLFMRPAICAYDFIRERAWVYMRACLNRPVPLCNCRLRVSPLALLCVETKRCC